MMLNKRGFLTNTVRFKIISMLACSHKPGKTFLLFYSFSACVQNACHLLSILLLLSNQCRCYSLLPITLHPGCFCAMQCVAINHHPQNRCSVVHDVIFQRSESDKP